MTDQIKNFFSTAFAVVGLGLLIFGLYKLPYIGWDKAKFYFCFGAGAALIAKFIDFTRNYDGDDF